jgi:hypothetical protein
LELINLHRQTDHTRFEVFPEYGDLAVFEQLGWVVTAITLPPRWVTETLTVEDPLQVRAFRHDKKAKWWYGEGRNHDVVNGFATREVYVDEEVIYTIDVKGLTGLLNLVDDLDGEGYWLELTKFEGKPLPILILKNGSNDDE